MTDTTNDAIPTPNVNTLAGLRAVAHASSHSVSSMLEVADYQAWLLRTTLPFPVTRISALVALLVPRVRVDYVDNLPMPGTAFWDGSHWHIHIRADDPPETQDFTILHELKHIIDHPLRRQPNSLSDTDWENIADHFAHQFLTQEARKVVTPGERRTSP